MRYVRIASFVCVSVGFSWTTASASAPWTAEELQAQVSGASARGEPLLVPAGDYIFRNASLLITGARQGFAFRASGGAVRLWFDIKFGFVVTNSEDIDIVGPIEIDYTTGAYYQGTIVSFGESPGTHMAKVKTDFGFLDPDVFCERYLENQSWYEAKLGPCLWRHGGGGFAATKHTGGWSLHNNDCEQMSSRRLGDSTFAFSVPDNALVGDKLYVGLRGGLTLHTHNSTRVTYTNVSIHGSTFMSITEFDGVGGHVYRNVRVVVRNVSNSDADTTCANGTRLCHGILASNADCFHSSGVKHGPKLYDVELSSTFDDYLNIHTRTQVVGQREIGAQNRLTILDPRLKRDKGLANDAPYGTAETFQHVVPGNFLSFYELNSLQPLATREVSSITRISNVTSAAAMAAKMNKDMTRLSNPLVLPIDVCGTEGEQPCLPRAWGVVLGGEPLPASVQQYSLVHLVGWDASGSVVEGNYYHGGFDGIRWKSNNAVIRNNRWAVQYLEVTPLQHYLEGPLALSNVTIENNVFLCGDGYTTDACMSGGFTPKVSNGGFCRGNDGDAKFYEGACTNMTLFRNTYAQPPHLLSGDVPSVYFV